MIAKDGVLPTSRFEASEFDARFYKSFVFTFVRHPLKRAYSCYNEKILCNTRYSFGKVRTFLHEEYGADFNSRCSPARESANFLAFLLFVRDTQVGTAKFRKDAHWMPQWNIIRNASLRRSIDFIGRVETLEEDFSFVTKKAFLEETTLPHFNEAPAPPVRYEDVLNEEIKQIGREIYKEDLKNFAYEI
jgi:hypothetical protein